MYVLLLLTIRLGVCTCICSSLGRPSAHDCCGKLAVPQLPRSRLHVFSACVASVAFLCQGPVASVFWLDDALESALRLDGIVTLVDAKNIRRQLLRDPDGESGRGEVGEKQPGARPRNEAAMQVAYADRILVNKVSGDVSSNV